VGNGGMSPLVIIFGTKWKPVVSLASRPLYTVGTSPTVRIGVGLRAGLV
jgi:hypothetical protein